MRATVALLLAASCGRIGFDAVGGGSGGSGGSGADVGETTDGTRLAAIRWRTADGSITEFTHHWYDRVFDERCFFSSPSGRCLPLDATLDYSTYSDPACTTPAVLAQTGCSAPPRHVVVSNHVFEIGSPLDTAYKISSGSCVGGSGSGFFTVGAEIPLEMFVGTTLETTAGVDTDRVDLVGDDGSREYLYPQQHANDGTDVEQLDAMHAAVMPRPAGGSDVSIREYRDPACTILVTEDIDPMRRPYQIRYVTDPCRRSVFSRADPILIVDTLYRQTSSGCTPRTATGTMVQDIVDLATTSATFTRVVGPGTTRLRRYFWQSPGGDLLPAGVFDTERGAPCSTVTIKANGRAFCVHEGLAVIPDNLFGDASCSTFVQTGVSCDGALPVDVGFTGTSCGLQPAIVNEMSTPATSPRFQLTGYGCAPYTPESGQLFEATATPIDTSMLVELTLGHD